MSAQADDARLLEFMGRAVVDMGAALNAMLVMIGGELGLWEAMTRSMSATVLGAVLRRAPRPTAHSGARSRRAVRRLTMPARPALTCSGALVRY